MCVCVCVELVDIFWFLLPLVSFLVGLLGHADIDVEVFLLYIYICLFVL